MPVKEWKKIFEGSVAQMTLNAGLLGKDANYAVLTSALANMKAQLPHPAFIIIAGDFIWHNARPQDSVLKRKTIQFIAQLFKERFPDTPVIPAMGNNDTYGEDYALQDPKFLADFAHAWEPNLPRSSAADLLAQGYYTYENENLKLVVINSALVNAGTSYSGAGTMLTWLKRNVMDAGGKKVWVISHIPPGINGYNSSKMWNDDYTQKFIGIVTKYPSVVKFSVASHTHLDDYKVFYNTAKKPVSLLRIIPSICSNHGNNPSFEVAGFNSSSGDVISEMGHYLNLAADLKGKSPEQVQWAGSFDVASALKIKGISAVDFSKLTDNIKADKTQRLLNNYIKFYTVSTKIDSARRINHNNYMNYLEADSLIER